jgi:hypothetical protein
MPTTNNNWPTPVATDLVKDGWEAIKDLGDAIDTTLGVYSPATPMGVHLSTVTFSGVASQAVDDIFSSTYDNYVIAVNISSVASGDVSLRLNFRTTGGVDVTTNLSTQRISFYTSVVGATIANATFGASGSSNPTFSNYVLNVANPNLARRTTYASTGGYVNNAGQPFIDLLYGYHSANDVHTGIKIFPSASTFSGSISIYGVSK